MSIPLKIFLVASAGLLPMLSRAQFGELKDSLVQLTGVVMSADSLKALPGATIVVKGQHRATLTDDRGLFSIVVMKGDTIQFSYVGYKSQDVRVPNNITGNQYSVIKTMTTDTQYLAVTIIRPRPSRAQFERDFVNLQVDHTMDSLSRVNMDPKILKGLAKSLPRDAKENANYNLTNGAKSYYYSGQVPPMKLFDIPSWKSFIKSWKTGAYKQ